MVDLSGDGKQDVISGSWPGELTVFAGEGEGRFAAGQVLNGPAGEPIQAGQASAVFATDWDRDGDLDLLVGNIDGHVSLVQDERAAGAKQAAFGAPTRLQVGTTPLEVDGDAGPCVADWDGDGRADLIVGTGDGHVVWFRDTAREGAPRLAAAQTIVQAAGPAHGAPAAGGQPRPAGRTKPCVADWDGDGKLDLLVGDFSYEESSTHGHVWLYRRAAAEPLTPSTSGGAAGSR